MSNNKLNHSELCLRAGYWLKKTFNCRFVLIEPHAYTTHSEIPDVIGWVGGRCILVECKTSISDFKKDQKKIFRSDDLSNYCIGNWRFYFTDGDILKEQNIPKGWGYYFVNDKNKIIYSKGEKYSNASQSPFLSRHIDEVAFLLYGINKMKLCFSDNICEDVKLSNKIIF